MQALYKAEYDYTAQTDDELTIREDQLVFLLQSDDDGWIKVRIKIDNPGSERPKEGLVPANYVVSVASIATVTAAYDYEADPSEPEELTMRENESLQLFEKGEDWSLVGRTGAVGFVPTAYLDDTNAPVSTTRDEPQQAPPHSDETPGASASRLPPPPRALRMTGSSDEEDVDDNSRPSAALVAPPPAPPAAATPQSAPPSSNLKRGTMAYDFEATDPDEISVSEGDAVLVLDDQSEDWWMVKLLSSGREGNVPAQYVEIDTTVPAPSPAPALPRSTPTPPAASSAPTSPPLKNSMGVVPPPQRPRASTAASQSSIPQEQEQESEPEEADEDRRAQIDADAAKAKRIHDAEQRRIMKAAEARDMRTAKGIHFADEVDSPSASRMPAPRPIPVPRTPDDLSGSPAPPEADRKTPSVPEVSKSDRKKPNMAKTRIWKDRTGNFKVEAEFLGVSNGKVRLHKVNGVVIDVPVDKMASEDVKLIKNLVKRDRERQTSEDDIPLATSSVRSPDNDRERKEREKRHRAQQHQKKKPQVDWFDFFLSAGCDLDDCTRYAHNFERDRIDEEVLPELEANTLRNLGLREGDLIRVRKHIKAKFGRSAAIPQDDAGSSKVESGDKEGPGLFTGPSGGLKSTRRGRPTPSRGGADSVNPDGLKNASEELSRVSSPPSREAQNASPSPSKGERRSSSVQPIVGSAGGFDDDAWTVKPSSKPATPQPAPAPAPSAAPAAPSPQPQSVSPTPQQPQSNNDLAEDILKRMGITDKPSISAASQQRQTASGFLSPNTLSSAPPPQPSTSPQPNPNGPRGPFAPVAQNAPMLNPLVPTQTGFSGFIPTRPASGGMQPQATGMSISMNSGMSMAPQPTGMMAQPQMSMGTSMPMSMAPQPTGFMMQQQQTQPTGFQNPQMTSFSQPQMPQYQSPSPQVNVQPTGMGQVPMSGGLAPQPTGIFSNPSMFGGAPQQQPQPTGSTPANKYEPGNVFAAMKSGQSSMDSAPQSSSTYDALRPQMTGVPAQPLQPQPTGFASMQMQMPTQTGMPGYGYY